MISIHRYTIYYPYLNSIRVTTLIRVTPQFFPVHTHDNNNYCLYYAPVHVLLFYLSEFCHLAKLADICLQVELTAASLSATTESSWPAWAVISHT